MFDQHLLDPGVAENKPTYMINEYNVLVYPLCGDICMVITFL